MFFIEKEKSLREIQGEPNKTPMSSKPILWGAKTKRGEGAVILAFKSLIKTV